MEHKVLIVDDDPTLRRLMRELISTRNDCEFVEAPNEHEAAKLIEQSLFWVVVTDYNLSPGGGSDTGGLAVLDAAKKRDPDTQVIVVTSRMRAELPGEVRRGHGFSCVDRGSGYYEQQLPYEVKDALRRFKQARAEAHMAFKVFIPRSRSADPIQFQLTRMESNPNTSRRPFALEFDAMKEATAGIGSLILVNEPNQCAALSQFVGRHLWDRVFGDHADLLLRLGEGRGMMRGSAHLPIRIVGERGALDIPFELLHDGDEYLALQHPLVREVAGARSRELMLPGLFARLRDENQVLRVLLIAADTCDEDRGLGPIPMADQEVRRIEALFKRPDAPVQAEVKVIESAETNSGDIAEVLKQHWHVVHYAGHSTYREHDVPQSALYFWQNSCSKADWLQWRNSGEIPSAARSLRGDLLPFTSNQLLNCLQNSVPSLFYFSCCHSARTAGAASLLYNKSLGLLDAVAHAGVPTVVGHRWPMVDTKQGLSFVESFYEKLVRGYVPEDAILRARRELQEHDYVWASPVMYVQYPGS